MMTQTAERLMLGLKRLRADKHGATSIEYALIAVLISIVIAASASAVGTSLNSIFDNVASKLDEANG
jgi:pilus assembly protein Flp/PilA